MVRTVWFEVEIGVEGEQGADLFQVGVRVGMPEGTTGPLPRNVKMIAEEESEAEKLVIREVEAITTQNWHDAVEVLRKLGFRWEYEGRR